MKRSFWIYELERLDPLYLPEVLRFIDNAKNHTWITKNKYIHCTCMNCRNVVVFDDTQQILSHLICQGFIKDYLIWTKHEEGSSAPYRTGNPANNDAYGLDMLADGFDFVHETQQPDIDGSDAEHVVPNVTNHGSAGENEGVRTHILPNNIAAEDAEFLEAMLRCHRKDPSVFFIKGMEALMKAAEEPLYDKSKGCNKEFTTLRSVLKLLVYKARYGLSDAGIDALSSIIANMLPKENKVPANTYYTKKLISLLKMGVEKIHACRNYYILYPISRC